MIESQLLECLGAEEIDRRRLICGNPYSFQGDERDVIIVSATASDPDYVRNEANFLLSLKNPFCARKFFSSRICFEVNVKTVRW